MTFIFKASPRQLVFAYIRSGLAIGFGIALFIHIPTSIRYVMLLSSCLIAIASPIEENYNRLEISDRSVTLRTISKRWSVPLSEIKDWKIKGDNSVNHSLHIFTQEGREYCVLDVNRFCVRDHNKEVVKALAKCLRNHRRGK
jgi:hypothetical protein